jgi:hypothetical protein
MKELIARNIRARSASHIVDLSGVVPGKAAIYTLADPRDMQCVRYVGQTGNPRRRFLQHVNTARLWLPDDVPWWIKSPKLRPLYDWIRELYRDECRMPVMAVIAWTEARHARLEERKCICERLGQQLPLLNWEAEMLKRQLQLI